MINILKLSKFEASLLFCKFASANEYNAKWRQKVEDAYAQRTNRLDQWFGAETRVYVPFSNDSVDRVMSWLSGCGFGSEQGYRIDFQRKTVEKDGRIVKFTTVADKVKHAQQKPFKQQIEKVQIDRKLDEQQRKSRILFLRDEIEQIEESFKPLYEMLSQLGKTNFSYSQDMMIVYSRDPHDIGMMSYDRYWGSNEDNPVKDKKQSDQSSCVTLGDLRSFTDGSGKIVPIHTSVLEELKGGGCVAYVTSADDKNLETPVARIWIRLFCNQETGNCILKPESKVYCASDFEGYKEEFKMAVSNWCERGNKNASGVYKLQGGEYSDTYKNRQIHNVMLDDMDYVQNHFSEIMSYEDSCETLLSQELVQKIEADENSRFKLRQAVYQYFYSLLYNIKVDAATSMELNAVFDSYNKIKSTYANSDLIFPKAGMDKLIQNLQAFSEDHPRACYMQSGSPLYATVPAKYISQNDELKEMFFGDIERIRQLFREYITMFMQRNLNSGTVVFNLATLIAHKIKQTYGIIVFTDDQLKRMVEKYREQNPVRRLNSLRDLKNM